MTSWRLHSFSARYRTAPGPRRARRSALTTVHGQSTGARPPLRVLSLTLAITVRTFCAFSYLLPIEGLTQFSVSVRATAWPGGRELYPVQHGSCPQVFPVKPGVREKFVRYLAEVSKIGKYVVSRASDGEHGISTICGVAFFIEAAAGAASARSCFRCDAYPPWRAQVDDGFHGSKPVLPDRGVTNHAHAMRARVAVRGPLLSRGRGRDEWRCRRRGSGGPARWS